MASYRVSAALPGLPTGTVSIVMAACTAPAASSSTTATIATIFLAFMASPFCRCSRHMCETQNSPSRSVGHAEEIA